MKKTYNTFETKEEYLQYRMEWKAAYKELSQTIRDFKFCNWYESLGEKRKSPEGDIRYAALKAKYNVNWWYVGGLKAKAKAMLQELKEAKLRAQEQYLKQKELVAA